MKTHLFGLALLSFTLIIACDSGAEEPDAASVAGRYTLMQYGGAALPNGGVTAGNLRLRIDQTIPVYEADWIYNGAGVVRSGLYSVEGRTVEFTETSGADFVTYFGTVEGNRITVSLNDGTFTSFTFERE